MANIDSPRGFYPIRTLSGGPIQTKQYLLESGATVYQGDVVELNADGTVGAAEAGDATAVIGVAAHYAADAGSTGTVKVLVYDSPDIVFGAQLVTGITPTQSTIGLSGDHIAGSGSATTKLSGHEINTPAAASNQFMIIGLVDKPDNTFAEHADFEVVFNEHRLKGSGASGV